VRALRNGLWNLPPELGELEFPVQRLEMEFSMPMSVVALSIAASNSRKCASEARE
jgi:hypothetical protein